MLLVTVSTWSPDAIKTRWSPKSIGPDSENCVATPVPPRSMLCVAPSVLSSSVMSSVAFSPPFAVGANVMSTVHVSPGLSEAPLQLSLLLVKSFEPLSGIGRS